MFWGIIGESVSESSKPAELQASSSVSLAIPEDALRNGTRSVAVVKEIEGRKQYGGVARPHRLPVL